MSEFLKDTLILYSNAQINGKSGEISLFKDKILWRYYNKLDNVCNCLAIKDIISVRDNYDFVLKGRLIQSPKIINTSPDLFKNTKLVIYSIITRQNKPCEWNILSTSVYFDEVRQCSKWNETIKKLLENLYNEFERPRCLEVFINPIGGNKTGVKLFDSKVKPIFDLAGITVNLTVTERRDEAKEYILKHRFHRVDGLVCVGGDGMLMELIHGLLLKARIEAGHADDSHHPLSTEFQSPIRVGIIAAGSTDSVAYSTIGTKDAVTSALHIVRGSNVALDTIAVFTDNKFLRYNISLMGYGFYGNCVSESETLRWMGPKRYDWLGFKHLMSLTTYYGELKYKPAYESSGDPRDGNFCTERCVHCSSAETESDNIDTNRDWVVVRDRFVAINSFLISCRCHKSPIGPAPYAHLGNGFSDLVIVRECNRFNFLQHLLKSASFEDRFDFDFIETVRVSEFSFTPISEANPIRETGEEYSKQFSIWNCDGEPLYQPEIYCKVHRQLIRLFANGIPVSNGTNNNNGSIRSLASDVSNCKA